MFSGVVETIQTKLYEVGPFDGSFACGPQCIEILSHTGTQTRADLSIILSRKGAKGAKVNLCTFAPLREILILTYVRGPGGARLYSEMTSGTFSDTRNRSAEFFTISWWLGKGTLHWRRDK